MKYFKIVLFLLVVFFTPVVIYSGVFPTTEAFDSSASVAELKEVELGSLNQWVSIRGENRSNPVLLWLHGGPGLTQMPFAHHLDSELEKEFVVVHWDQRGAGKSNPLDFDESTMSFEQFISDSHELVRYLQNSFNQEKIYILGHSWGSMLGIELVNRYPEDFHAYISVTQIVDVNEGLDISYAWLKNEIEKNEDEKNIAKLQRIGKPPYNHAQYKTFASILIDYDANIDGKKEELALIGVQAPEYNVVNYVQWLDGALRNSRPMWSSSAEFSRNYREEIPSVDIPIYFFVGKKDYTTPTVLIEDYFEKINAPKKELIVFENSAHTPFLGETEKFNEELIKVKGE